MLALQSDVVPNSCLQDHTYANMIYMLDTAVGNVTDALVSEGLYHDFDIIFGPFRTYFAGQ